MRTRMITGVTKDKDGDIERVCGNRPHSFNVSSKEAISDIESEKYAYKVNDTLITEVDVVVVYVAGKTFLRTNPDFVKPNNLDNLPNC